MLTWKERRAWLESKQSVGWKERRAWLESKQSSPGEPSETARAPSIGRGLGMTSKGVTCMSQRAIRIES